MKDDGVDITHLNAIRSAFLLCPTSGRDGEISKSDLLEKLDECNLQFPRHFLQSLIKDMQVNPADDGLEATLNYDRFMKVIDVYN